MPDRPSHHPEALADRPGLAPRLRLALLCQLAAWRHDAAMLRAASAVARARGVARSDLEESLLQGVLFYGFPRSVSAFAALEEAWPADRAPGGGALPRERQVDAGRALFDAIYADNAPAVHAMLRGYHAEFHDFVLEAAYGRVLTRPALTAAERELLAAGTLAAMEQIPQMVAHGRGALRFGATVTEVGEALWTALTDDAEVAEHVRRIEGRARGRPADQTF